MNVKVFSIITAFFFAFTAPAHAELPSGCMPKEVLQAAIKSEHQSMLEQGMFTTKNGEVKLTVTGLHNGTGYVEKGRGYIVESRGNEACVIAKTELVSGPGKDEVTVSTLHEFAGQTLTAAEFKKVAAIVLKDEATKRAEWKKKGFSDKLIEDWIWAFKKIQNAKGMPFENSMKAIYRLEPSKAVIVERTPY